MKKLFLPFLILFAAATVEIYAEIYQPIITVLDFSVSGVPESEAAVLTDYITAHLVECGKFRVIDRSRRQTILGELKFSYEGCADEECQLEIGKLLAAENIFTGSIGKVGTRYIINISFIEVETGESLRSFSERYPDLDTLVDDTARIVNIFAGTEREQESRTRPAETGPVQASAAAAEPVRTVQPQTPRKNLPPMYFDLGMLAGGPLEHTTQFDGIGWGLYLGGGFSIAEYIYLGGELSILVSTEDSDDGGVMFGPRVCFGNPSELAVNIGVDFANGFPTSSGVTIGGTVTVFIGGFDIRVFYGNEISDAIPVLTFGLGGHF